MSDHTRHTPGPWNVFIPEAGAIEFDIYQDDDSGDAIQTVNNPEGRANARLIGSAPELLDILKKLTGAADYLCHKRSRDAKTHTLIAISAARAAIAKAENARLRERGRK